MGVHRWPRWERLCFLGLLASVVITASPCADKEVMLDGRVSDCRSAGDALSAAGLQAACPSYFCASCAYASTCDASCGFCHDPASGPAATLHAPAFADLARAAADGPCADEKVALNGKLVDCATAAFATSAYGLGGACPAFFCATCAYAHACDHSCGWCRETGAADAAEDEAGQKPPRVYEDARVDVATTVDEAHLVWAGDMAGESLEPTPEDDQSPPPDWWPCPLGELLDCRGRCRASSACTLAPAAYATCRHWIGDGACDDGCYGGFSSRGHAAAVAGVGGSSAVGLEADVESEARCGRRSDAGDSMAWNCPLYGCDGGDCEVCSPNPPSVPPHAVAPRRLVLQLAYAAAVVDPNATEVDSDQQWLWPGPDQRLRGGRLSGSSSAGEATAYRAQCRNLPLHVAGGAALACAEALAHGLATCEGTFCDGCGALAGACDDACGFCTRGEDPNDAPWPARGRPWPPSAAVYPGSVTWPWEGADAAAAEAETKAVLEAAAKQAQVSAGADAAAQARAHAKAELAEAIRLARTGLSGRGGGRTTDGDTRDENSHREATKDYTTSPGNITAAAAAAAASTVVARPVSWVIVLTACVSPLPGVTHTSRATPHLRTRDYAAALRRWAGAPYPPRPELGAAAQAAEGVRNASLPVASVRRAWAAWPPWPVVVVESSGANLTSLRRAVAEGYAAAQAHHHDAGHSSGNGFVDASATASSGEQLDSPGPPASSSLPRGAGQRRRRARRARRAGLRPIEFVSMQLTRAAAGEAAGGGPLARGKGVAEAASIVAALERSELVRRLKPTHAVKVTGRYFVRNLDAELHRIADEAAAAAAAAAATVTAAATATTAANIAASATVAAETSAGATAAAGEAAAGEVARKDTSLAQAVAALWPSGQTAYAQPWPLLALQATPSPWSLWDGVVRSEVVGFALCNDRNNARTSSKGHNRDCSSDCSSSSSDNSSANGGAFAARGVARWAEAVFAGQDEAVGRPMERALFEGARDLPHPAVQRFGPLEVDPARNAENDLVLRL